MRLTAALSFLAAAACASEAPEPGNGTDIPQPSGPPVVQQVDEPVAATPLRTEPAWEAVTGPEGTGLRLVAAGGQLLLGIGCRDGTKQLAVVAPAFRPIGSEDRFSLGLGDEPVTLVANPTEQKGGAVRAEAPAPEAFGLLLGRVEKISAVYGAQRAGPYPAPPDGLKRRLTEACSQ